ncbi:MAG: dihydrolipoyl dehydrogenase family protein [Xanthobacteraceae bacterium]
MLGSGNAGMAVTVETRKAGLSVAMAENRELGGTCPNRGCTPKKVMVAAGHALGEIARAGGHCISVGKPRVDWAALIDREKELISHLPASFAKLMADRGVDVVHERAVFAGPNAVRVGNRILEAENIVIATGSKPRRLPIEGAEHMITSDDILSERTQPHEAVFVGGGVIAFEFAHVYARAGTRVTILEVLPRFLPALDQDAVTQIVHESKRIGITLITNVKVKRIEGRGAGRVAVLYEHEGAEQTLEADRVVNGAGRVADVDTLDLQAGNVRLRDGRIDLDPYMRSVSNQAVYVCGDALWSSPQLSPVATYEGRIVGRNIVEGAKEKPDYSCIPSCVFTVPALASVGLTEAKAKESGQKVKVETNDMSDWMSSRTYNESAWAKVIYDDRSGRILGAQLAGHAAEELIHIFAFAIKFGITANDIRETVYAFPTFSNDIKSLV